jgi:hypothetical protein
VQSLTHTSSSAETDATTARNEARGVANDLRRRIIPIRVLDFAPLPRSTSLITWVAAQLREFIDLLDERMTPHTSNLGSRQVVPWEPSWEQELPSRRAWADLAASAAWGWDDNIQARKGALDPDAYAEELQQSERARVGIVERWRTLIRTIVADAAQRYPSRISANGRIVIPIDDVDMNPQRTGELLEFVRTFWDPQLVFLLSGDSALITAALQQQYAKVLEVTKETAASFSPSPRDLAAQSYDKVVPIAQRFRLGPLMREERIALLKKQLCKLQALEPSSNLAPEQPGTLEELLRCDPWAAEALPATLREVHDVRQKLMPKQTVSEVVADLWSSALSREALTDERRREIRNRVDLSSEGLPSVEGEIEAFAERLGEVGVQAPDRTTKRRGHRTRLVLEVPSDLVPSNFPESQRLRGAFLLAADLAAADPDAAWSAITIAARGYKFPAVRARIVAPITSNDRLARRRAETWLRRGTRWPVPDWPAPIVLARFAQEWRKVAPDLVDLRGEAMRDRGVAMAFLRLVQSVFQDRPLPAASPAAAGTVTEEAFTSMLKAIFEVSDTQATRPRQIAYVDWAQWRAPLLAAPESGLQASVAKEVLEALSPAANPDPTELERARFDRAHITLNTVLQENLGTDDVHAVLAAIDASFSDHPWVGRFHAWPA